MATDYFLKIEGVKGESEKDGFTDQIEIESFSWGETQKGSHGTGGGGGAGKVDMQEFRFTTKTNKASPKLMLYCATGQHPKTAVLACRKAGGGQQPYLKWTLTNVTVTSYQIGGAAGDATIPTDSFALGFDKIEVEYKPQKPDGSLGAAETAGYDLTKTKKV